MSSHHRQDKKPPCLSLVNWGLSSQFSARPLAAIGISSLCRHSSKVGLQFFIHSFLRISHTRNIFDIKRLVNGADRPIDSGLFSLVANRKLVFAARSRRNVTTGHLIGRRKGLFDTTILLDKHGAICFIKWTRDNRFQVDNATKLHNIQLHYKSMPVSGKNKSHFCRHV